MPPPPVRLRRALFVAALWLGLVLLLELGLRLAHALGGSVPPAADESLEKEWRWAERHLAAGAAVLESNFVHDPLTGWRNAPGLRGDGLTTNSAGLRGSREFPLERRAGVRRVVLVGDSYTFGVGVRDEETFAHLLGTGPLPGEWEVLNLAVPGSGTDQQVLEFEQRGRAYAPDVAVLGFFVRDYSRNVLWFRDYAKPLFEADDALAPDGLRLTHSPVIAPEALYAEYLSGRRRVGGAPLRSWVLASLGARLRSLSERSVGPGVPAWDVLARLMARFQRLAREAGATPLWLVIPDRHVLDPADSSWLELEQACELRARELGLACLRLDAAFRAHAAAHPHDPVYDDRSTGGHLSPTGHRIVAEELARRVAGLPAAPR